MNRRQFTSLAIGGAALAFTRKAWAIGSTQEVLLARAKSSLDQHHSSFALRDRVGLADFSRPSRELRFHIVDLMGGTVSSYLVAHGRGSDPDHSGWLERFSNEPNSLASSSGAYLTGEFYNGVHGQAMRLKGLDPNNYNAEPRAIVIHGAPYVSENQISTWGKIGRSEGCFAVAEHMLPQVIGLLGSGRMLYSDKV